MCCLSAIALFSCHDDPEDFTAKMYINADNPRTTYLIEPGLADFSVTLNMGIPRPAAEEIRITMKADPSLVGFYNNFFMDNAVALPDGHYVMTESVATVAQGSVRSTDVGVEFRDIGELDDDLVYVLPVTIAGADRIGILESARTHYYIFRKGALINWAADIEKNYFPINWADPSVVNSLNEITVESMLYIRQVEREGSDAQIMTFFGVENDFLIRLGDMFAPGEVMVVKDNGRYPGSDRTSVPVGRWFHLAVTYDAQGNIRIYLDGELKSISTTNHWRIRLTSDCYIGKSYNNNRWWPGMICETRVWNTVRTQQQIAEGMYRVPADSEGLVAYWKFDEGQGDRIADYSGNNNTITAASGLKWVGVSLPE